MESTFATYEEVVACPVCTSQGLKFSLRLFQINFEEAVSMCENPECTYPILEEEPLIQARSACHLPPSKPAMRPKQTNKSSRFGLNKNSDSDSAISTNSGSSYASWCSTVSQISDASSSTSTFYHTSSGLQNPYSEVPSPALSCISVTDREVEQLTQFTRTQNDNSVFVCNDSDSIGDPGLFASCGDAFELPKANTDSDYDFLDAIVAEVVGESAYTPAGPIPSQESAFCLYSNAPSIPSLTDSCISTIEHSSTSEQILPTPPRTPILQLTLPQVPVVPLAKPRPQVPASPATRRSTAKIPAPVATAATPRPKKGRPSTAPLKAAPVRNKRRPVQDPSLMFDLEDLSEPQATKMPRTVTAKKPKEVAKTPPVLVTAKKTKEVAKTPVSTTAQPTRSSSINLVSNGLRTAKMPSGAPRASQTALPLSFRILTPDSESGGASGESSPVSFTSERSDRVQPAASNPRKLRINVTLNNLLKKGLTL